MQGRGEDWIEGGGRKVQGEGGGMCRGRGKECAGGEGVCRGQGRGECVAEEQQVQSCEVLKPGMWGHVRNR